MNNTSSISTTSGIDLDKTCKFPSSLKPVSVMLLVLVMLPSVIENVVFCHAVYCSQRLHKKSMVLIVNLSVSDTMISLVLPTLEILKTVFDPDWPLGEVGMYLLNCVWLFSIVSPFVIVTSVTFERYVSLTKPAVYMKYVTKRLMKIVVIVLWLYSLAWVALLGSTMHFKDIHVYEWNVNFSTYHAFIGLHILVPLVVIPVIYYRIIRHVKKTRNEVVKRGNSAVSSLERSDIKLTETVMRVIIALYVIWIPVFVIEAIYGILDVKSCTVRQSCVASIVLSVSNCFINPILYSYKNAEIRKSLNERLSKIKEFFLPGELNIENRERRERLITD